MTGSHRYDVQVLRAQIPALKAGYAHFDGPGGTQIPQFVIDAITDALSRPLCNRGAHTAGERAAEAIVTEAREAFADLLGATADGIVFGRSSTQITYDFSRTLSRTWSAGDEVVVTRLDHDCNVRPWLQAAARVGAVVRWADFDPVSGELTPDHVEAMLSDRTRLVAVTAASNLIGTRPDVSEIARRVHQRGALLYVDAAHCCAHASIDLEGDGADLVTCSVYKFLGPHLGVLAARPQLLRTLHPDKLSVSTDAVPERFELGILPYGVLAGAAATVEFLSGLGAPGCRTRRERLASALGAIEAHEDALRPGLERRLAEIGPVTIHSRARRRTPTLLLTIDGGDVDEAYRFLAARGVDAGAGTFYSLEAARRLGVGERGGLRVGLAPYTTEEDLDRLVEGLTEYVDSVVRSGRRPVGLR